jgi:hypothetical protein
VLSKVLDRFASKALSLPPAKRHPPRNIAQALQDADGGEREGKPLIDLTAFD